MTGRSVSHFDFRRFGRWREFLGDLGVFGVCHSALLFLSFFLSSCSSSFSSSLDDGELFVYLCTCFFFGFGFFSRLVFWSRSAAMDGSLVLADLLACQSASPNPNPDISYLIVRPSIRRRVRIPPLSLGRTRILAHRLERLRLLFLESLPEASFGLLG